MRLFVELPWVSNSDEAKDQTFRGWFKLDAISFISGRTQEDKAHQSILCCAGCNSYIDMPCEQLTALVEEGCLRLAGDREALQREAVVMLKEMADDVSGGEGWKK